ncbi:MAG: choice-of-anchor B family protein [Anaerolineales bacterium]|nr:choice-of-anchor B family protein [Anaerolineales bacterium]
MNSKPKSHYLLFAFGIVALLMIAVGWTSYLSAFAQGPDSDPSQMATEAAAVRMALMARMEREFQPDPLLDAPQTATPCVGGMAGIYPCLNVDLLAYMPLASIGGGSGANDIWGWTDPLDGKEYALVGLTNGTSFVEVTNPETPLYLGRLPTHTSNSTWRDIKVYNNYAFVVSEASGHGMQVFDLTRLRTVPNPPVNFTEDAFYGAFGNAHNLAINEETGFAYAIGSNTCSGGLHMINIQTPLSPSNAGCYSADGYTHDTQCVLFHGPDANYQGHEICFSANEDTLTVTDVSNKANPVLVARMPYAGSAYTHQGWLTEDHAFFLLDDELDEQNFGHNTRTRIWTLTDLTNPTIIGVEDGPNPSIDHNVYTHEGNAYMSNYTSGLQIFDLSDVANGQLVLAGFFDSYPSNNNANFNGSWSNYPYFTSGTVIHTGIGEGLFITRPVLNAQFALSASNTNFSICVAGSENTLVEVNAQNGYTGNVTLSTVNLPAGTTSTFAPNPVAAPGSSMFTVTVSTTSAGVYPFTVLGDDGILTDTLDASLSVFDGIPGVASLISPANGASDVGLQPNFQWSAVSGANAYFIEIATDASFTNIVDSATVATNSYTPSTNLAGNTLFFWRITAHNACGASPVSATFHFTTLAFLCRAPALPIADNTTATDTFVIGNTGTLQDLNVALNATHTYVGDLSFSLTHQDTGTSVTMIDRPGYTGAGFGCSGNNVAAELDDEGSDGPVENQCGSDPALFGHPTPNNPLSAFDGEDLAGTWVLAVTDSAGGDTGLLNEWCLVPTADTPPAPIIEVTPAALSSTQAPDTVVTTTLTLHNYGTADLTWEVTEAATPACSSPTDLPWVTVAPSTGTIGMGSATASTVTWASSGLSLGTYTGTLCVTSNDANNPLIAVPLALTVEAPPPNHGVALSGEAAAAGYVGTVVSYTLTMTNTGEVTDTFTLSVSGVWTVTVSVKNVTLGAGASMRVTVWVTVPGDVVAGASDATTVTATSQSDGSATASVTLTTTALALPPEEGFSVNIPIIYR